MLTDVPDPEGPDDENLMRTIDEYPSYIDSLSGSSTSLNMYDTAYFATGSKVEIVIGLAPNESEQVFRLTVGSIDPNAFPSEQIPAYNSVPGAAARYWQKVGGY